jgi:hypothetical protein
MAKHQGYWSTLMSHDLTPFERSLTPEQIEIENGMRERAEILEKKAHEKTVDYRCHPDSGVPRPRGVRAKRRLKRAGQWQPASGGYRWLKRILRAFAGKFLPASRNWDEGHH